MHSSTRKSVKRVSETQLSDLAFVSAKTTGPLIDSEDKRLMVDQNLPFAKTLPKKKLSATLKASALMTVGAVAFFLVRWILTAKSALTETFGSVSTTSQLFSNSVTLSSKPYTVRGRFPLDKCDKRDIVVISNYDGVQETVRPAADCSFIVSQMPESKKLAYTFNGQTNVVNLEKQLFRTTTDSSITLGNLPIIFSHENFIKTNLVVQDLQTGAPIKAFHLKVTANKMDNEVLSVDGTDGQYALHLVGGYYTAIITADGYRPVEIHASDLTGKKSLQVYMVSATLGTNMVSLKSANSQKTGLKVRFYDKNLKTSCVVSMTNQDCNSAHFFQKRDLANNIINEFVVYTETANFVVTPSVYKYKNTRRVLQNENSTIVEDSGENSTSLLGASLNTTDSEVTLTASAVVPKSEACKNDWTSKECQVEVTKDKSVDVTTVMSTYLTYSPNITCIRPNIQVNQQIRATKIMGDGNAIWFILQHNDTKFIIINGAEGNPASIILPDETIVEILSNRARTVAQNREMIATITKPNGQYFNIDQGFWNSISTISTSDFTGTLPKVNIQSSNVLDLSEDAYGNHLTRAVIEITDQAALDTLFNLNAKEGTDIHGLIYTSKRGYKIVKVNSFNPTQKTDTYRVCIYCLRREARRTKFEAVLANETVGPKDIRYHTFLRNRHVLKEFIQEKLHSVPRNTFIDNSHARYRDAYIKSEGMEVKKFTNKEIETIFGYFEAGKLRNAWFKATESSRLAGTSFNAYNIIRKDQLFIFSTSVASNFLSEETESFEPELDGKISADFDSVDYGYSGLVFTRDIVSRIYATGKNYKGLFIRATKSYANPAWPYKLAKIDGVVNKFYLNLAEVRAALGLSPIDGTTAASVSDPRTEPLLRRYENDIRESGDKNYLSNLHQVNFNRRYIDLNDSCLDYFFNLHLSGLFTQVDDAHVRLGENKFYYQKNNKIYIFKFDVLKTAYYKSEFSADTNSSILECLQMGTESTDPNELRRIIVNSTDLFEGYCHGTFINNTLCQGTFLGEHKSGCDSDYNCSSSGSEFQCEGITDKEGCAGTYKELVVIQGVEHDLVTYQPYNIISERIEGETKLRSRQNNPQNNILCKKGYDHYKEMCYEAEMTFEFPEHDTKSNGTIRCQGGLSLTNEDCDSQAFWMEQCDAQSLTPPGTCNGTYHLRDCENGGSVADCHNRVERDRVINCEMGFWDGEKCTIPPLYIIIDDNHFYSGTCQGEYIENNRCVGVLNGTLVYCSDPVTPQTLCTNEPTFRFTCNGTITSEGCVGTFEFDTSFRDHSFNAAITTDETPVLFTRAHNSSETHITFNRPNGENRIIGIDVVCFSNFSDETKTCGDAIYEESSYDGIFTRLQRIECKGTLNLNDLSCDSASYVVADCTTRFPFNQYPYCNGTFSGLRCVDGGSIENGCNGNQIANEKLSCPMGVWNGQSCKLRPVHIILNNAAYITGVCDGQYIENEYCEGTMNARVLVCPIDVTTDNLCNGPTVDKFVCVGKLTKYGCAGKYTGSINLKNAKLRLESPESALTRINKILNETVALTYEGVHPAYKVRTYGWETVSTSCGNGYADPTKTCSNARFKGVQQWKVNRTTFEATCEGEYDMESLVCQSRPYTVKHCNSTEPYENGRCNGTYIELKCADGGDDKTCFGAQRPEINIFCNGIFENGQCISFIPPTLSIIRVNATHWLKGVCSTRVEGNACVGRFSHGYFVACEGDPVSSELDFNSCKEHSGATVGICEGKINEEGCRGNYTHQIQIEGTTTTVVSSDADATMILYDFESFQKPVDMVINEQEIKLNVHCDVGFNPTSMECPEANLFHVKENADEDIPALTLKTETSCSGASLNLNTYACDGNFKFSRCLGRAHPLGGDKLKCLGDFYYAICPDGGVFDKCNIHDKANHRSKCLNSYWDGEVCGKDKPSVTSEIIVKELPHTVVKDVIGRDVMIGEFEVESFTMIGAFSSVTRLEGNVIKSLSLQSAEKIEDGTLKNIRLIDTEYPLSFDEGVMNKMIFQNFSLDELHYIQFATNDDYKLVHIKFKEFHIKDTMFVDMHSKNSVIRTLKYGSEQTQDFGVEDLPISLAYGYVNIRNAEVYLPYVSNSTIKKMMAGDINQKVSIVVPKIADVSIPSYRIHIKPKSDLEESEIYIEFPEFVIENLSVNLFEMEDVILNTKTLVSKPTVVSQVLKNYVEDVRLASVPNMPAPEAGA